MRAPDRFARRPTRGDLGFVELEAQLRQGRRHAQRALLAVGEELDELVRQLLALVVDAVAEDVQFAPLGRAVVHRGDLHGGNHAHARPLARGERL